MTDLDDFQINEDVLESQGADIIDQKMQEAIHQLSLRRETLLAYALHKGYDGVDIHMDNSVVADYKDYSMGFEYEAWEGEPPTLDRFGSNVRRYDFRCLFENEKKALLARIGVIDE